MKVSQQAILRDAEGKILILSKMTSPSWFLPGGRIEDSDDSWQKGFHREIKEELGCEVHIVRPFAVDYEPKWNVYAVAFICEVIGTLDIQLSDEHSEFMWVAPSEIPDYLYYKEIARAIVEQLG